jgi:hypothetical protein
MKQRIATNNPPATRLQRVAGCGRGLGLVFMAGALFALAGCAAQKPTTQPSRLAERAAKAEKDPFGYKPQNDRTDISGGGLDHFDKDAFGKDVDSVLNP